MSIKMQVEIDAIKARVSALENVVERVERWAEQVPYADREKGKKRRDRPIEPPINIKIEAGYGQAE